MPVGYNPAEKRVMDKMGRVTSPLCGSIWLTSSGPLQAVLCSSVLAATLGTNEMATAQSLAPNSHFLCRIIATFPYFVFRHYMELKMLGLDPNLLYSG